VGSNWPTPKTAAGKKLEDRFFGIIRVVMQNHGCHRLATPGSNCGVEPDAIPSTLSLYGNRADLQVKYRP
jgi:hypothetical protein